MIQATLVRHKDNLEDVELTGHAGSGEYDSDIVCATVSTLSASLVNSLGALTDCNADLAINEIDGGYMRTDVSHVTKRTGEKVQLLSESLLLRMTNLARDSQGFVSTRVITN